MDFVWSELGVYLDGHYNTSHLNNSKAWHGRYNTGHLSISKAWQRPLSMILDQLCASNTTACHWYMRCHQPWRGVSKLEPFVPCHAHPSTYAFMLHASSTFPLTSLAKIAGFISTFSLVSPGVHLCRDRNELFIDICDKFARLALHKFPSMSIFWHLESRSLLNRLDYILHAVRKVAELQHGHAYDQALWDGCTFK